MNKNFLSLVILMSLAQLAPAVDFGTEMMGATFKLFHPESTSTCFLLSEDHPEGVSNDASVPIYYLVTTAHSLERTTGETATLVLRKLLDNGAYARHDHKIQIREDGQELWVRHKINDVAVLKLSKRLPLEIPALPVTCLANEDQLKAADVHLCSPLFVLTYPERFEANAAGMPVARQGIFSSPPTLPSDTHPTFLADFNTFAGDSGGPVFIPSNDNKTPLVVGIVLGQHNLDERIETKNEQRLIKHPFGLGIVLHARYVRETLDLVDLPE